MNEDAKQRSEGEAMEALLRAARSDALSDDAAERLRRRLAAAGAMSAPVAVAGAAVYVRWLGLPLRSWVFAAIATCVSGGAWLAVRREPVPTPVASASSMAIASAPVASVSASEPPAPAVVAAPTLVASAPAHVASHAPRAVRAQSAPTASSHADGANEGALLLEARAILDANPARALALVRAHEKQFPESDLAPERARLAAEATRRLGARDGAPE